MKSNFFVAACVMVESTLSVAPGAPVSVVRKSSTPVDCWCCCCWLYDECTLGSCC